MAKLTVKDVQQKTTKSGKPYLAVKSSSDKFYTIWQEQQYIWHLFEPGKELDVIVATNGKFTSITGVVGVEGETTGQNQPAIGEVWEKLFAKLDRIEKGVDFLVEERKALGTLPKLDDLPVHDLDDINPEKLPF